MKAIPIKELIPMLESLLDEHEIIREDEIQNLFKRYGDDYFTEVSSWKGYELCKENELRKELLHNSSECEYIVSKGKSGYRQEYKCSFCGDSFYWTPSEMFPNRFNYCRYCGRKIVKFIDESKG